MSYATPEAIDEAIRHGCRSVHEIAARIGVDPTDYTLRANLAAMSNGGYLMQVDTDAKLVDGRVNWQYGKYDKDAPLHVGVIEEIAQAGPSWLKSQSFAAPADPRDEQILQTAAQLDPNDQSLRAQQVRGVAASINDHRRARAQEAADAAKAVREGKVEYVPTKVAAAVESLRTSRDRKQTQQALDGLTRAQLEQAARLAGCETFAKGAPNKTELIRRLADGTAGARADGDAMRADGAGSLRQAPPPQSGDEGRHTHGGTTGTGEAHRDHPAGGATDAERANAAIVAALDVTTVDGLVRILAEGMRLTGEVDQSLAKRANAETEDARRRASYIELAANVYRAAAEAAPRVFDHDPAAAATFAAVYARARIAESAARSRQLAAQTYLDAACEEAAMFAALHEALSVSEAALAMHRRIAEAVTSTTSSDLDKYRER